MVKFLSQFAAGRWFLYTAVLLPSMVTVECLRAARIAYDVWCVLVQQHEAGHRRRETAKTAAASPQAPHAPVKTIKFRRYQFPVAAADSATTEKTE